MKDLLNKLKGKSEKIKLEGYDVELELKSLSFTQLTELSKSADSGNIQEGLDNMLFFALRRAVPKKELDPDNGMTDEELKAMISEMDSGPATQIIKAVQKLSGLEVDDKSKKGLVVEGREKLSKVSIGK